MRPAAGKLSPDATAGEGMSRRAHLPVPDASRAGDRRGVRAGSPDNTLCTGLPDQDARCGASARPARHPARPMPQRHLSFLSVVLLALLARTAGAQERSARPDGSAPPRSGEPYLEIHVEKPVAPRPGGCHPVFPDKQRRQGMEGQVVARFIVDTVGRVEKKSLVIVSSTHPVFARAVRKSLDCMRFVPAERAGVKVRQIVEQPFDFRFAN